MLPFRIDVSDVLLIGIIPFGIGAFEVVVIGVVAVLLFGSRLPEVARSLGGSYQQFRKGLSEIQNTINTEIDSNKDLVNRTLNADDINEDLDEPDENRFLPPPAENELESSEVEN